MTQDALWYEAALVVGVTNALNVVADGLMSGGRPMLPAADATGARAALDAIAAFYGAREAPAAFQAIAFDPAYLGDVWAAVRRAFTDNRLSRRLKESLAFAASLTTRSAFGVPFHLEQMRRLGVSDRGVAEVVGVTQMFSSYTKIADTLQLASDMHDIAPVDRSPAPGGSPR
jgi:AhpD family alkylhydroperoxidase